MERTSSREHRFYIRYCDKNALIRETRPGQKGGLYNAAFDAKWEVMATPGDRC